MSRLHLFEVQARSSARPEVVHALLADAAGWSRWAGPLVPRSSWEDPDVRGVGAVARVGVGPLAVRVRVAESTPPRRFAYEVVSWHPFRDFLGEVRLQQEGSGTCLTWQAGFRTAVPGAGPAQRLALQRFLADVAQRLARHAEAVQEALSGQDPDGRPTEGEDG